MTGEATDSPLAGLRRAYAKRRQGAELFLPVPGWDDPPLVARITVPLPEQIQAISSEPGTAAWMADFVAVSVAGLYKIDSYNDDGEPKLAPLPGPDGTPLKFDDRFGAAIGADGIDDARSAVLAAFTSGGDGLDNPAVLSLLELGDFADRIERWLANTSRAVAGAIVSGR